MRLIDADALAADGWILRRIIYNDSQCHCCEERMSIGLVPLVDAEPIKHGVWEHSKRWDTDMQDEVDDIQCSLCGTHQDVSMYWAKRYFRYCPYCGAKMDGEE